MLARMAANVREGIGEPSASTSAAFNGLEASLTHCRIAGRVRVAGRWARSTSAGSCVEVAWLRAVICAGVNSTLSGRWARVIQKFGASIASCTPITPDGGIT